MDELPNEVLDCIFVNLHFVQKQECTLVCRRWSNIIRSTSLFSTIYIREKDSFDRLAQVLDVNPSYRTQIETLIVHGPSYNTLTAEKVYRHCPNLRFIYTENPSGFLETCSKVNEGVQLISNSQRNHIEKIELDDYYRFPLSMAYSGALLSLKKLVINYGMCNFTVADVVESSPNLNSLTLIEVMISLKDLESLHNGLKALELFKLEQAFLMINHEVDEPIEAHSIKALSITSVTTNYRHVVKWLNFISKKYTKLQHLRFGFSRFSTSVAQNEENVTNMGFLPLLKIMGRQLSSLDISSKDGVESILNTLDTFNHDIKTVRIHALYSASETSLSFLENKSIFIHQLTLVLNRRTWSKVYHLQNIETLKELKHRYGDAPDSQLKCICLNQLLESCSNLLESLEIHNFKIQCPVMTSTTFSLKKLTINIPEVTQHVWQFISHSLPNVHHLRITVIYHNNFTVMLSGVDFSYLDISSPTQCFILVRTLNDKMERYYHFGEYPFTTVDSCEVINPERQYFVRKINFEQSRSPECVLKVTCNSVKTLLINKKLAV